MISYLQIENVTKSYGETVLFEDISFGINKDHKIALIAKNGKGKTSLLNIIAGKDTADSGKVTFRNDIKIGYLEQDPNFYEDNTVIQQVFLSSSKIVNAICDYEAALKNISNPNVSEKDSKLKIQHATEQMDALSAWDFEVKIKQILSKLKIEDFNQKIGQLSGGQKKRIALANVLINEPDFLILDEPTNHLDLEMIEWLELYLKKSKFTLLMVTHDRYFLDRVCNDIVELDDNMIYRYRGNYSYFLEKRADRLQIRNANIGKANSLLKKELDWINRSPSARSTKAKYRIDNFYKIQDEASQRTQEQTLDINIQTTRLGKKIIEMYNLKKKFDNLVILDDFSHKFAKGEKIGIVGKNGSGKTTLLNLITNNIPLDSGRIEIGESVVVGYYQQSGINIKDDMRVIDVIKDVAEVITLGDNKLNRNKKLSAAQFLEYFLFKPETHYNYVSKLSGGERRRLYLMTVLMKNPNFLILDEPTNDLDIMTLNVLEEYLSSFGGCVLIVSHDRYFMDKVVESMFVFEGKGIVKHFPGNYSNYKEYQLNKEKQEKKNQKEAKIEKVKPQKKNTKKFSFKQKYEYDQLEKELQQLETNKKELEELINSGSLLSQELIDKSRELSEILDTIDEKEMRWLELSELKDS